MLHLGMPERVGEARCRQAHALHPFFLFSYCSGSFCDLVGVLPPSLQPKRAARNRDRVAQQAAIHARDAGSVACQEHRLIGQI